MQATGMTVILNNKLAHLSIKYSHQVKGQSSPHVLTPSDPQLLYKLPNNHLVDCHEIKNLEHSSHSVIADIGR